MSGTLSPPADPPPVGSAPKPVVSLPAPNLSTPEAPPPIASETGLQGVPRPRIGYSTAGLTGTDALRERRKSLEEADPESNVTQTGEIEPPMARKGFKGKLKSIGEGLLIGLASGDPDNPNNILGSAIGGGGLGAASNRGEAKLKRRFDLNALDNDIARGLKLEQEGEQLSGMKALTRQRELEPEIKAREFDIANERLEIERQKNAGLITEHEAARRDKALDRQSREKTNAATNEARIKAAEITAGQRGQETPAAADKRSREASAAQSEYDQLVADEQNAGNEKNKAYEYAKQVKANPQATKEDVAEAVRAAEDADKIYKSFGAKKTEAMRRVKENTSTSTPKFTGTQNLKGKKWSRSRFAAANQGVDIEAATQAAKDAGADVQP